MKRIWLLMMCVVLGVACTADDPSDVAASADGTEAASSDGTEAASSDGTEAASSDGTETASSDGTETASSDGTEAASSGAEPTNDTGSTTVTTTVGVTETTTETIPQTTIDNGAPETTGPVVTDAPAIEEPVPPVELQAYTDEIAVACAKVEFVYLGLRDGFDVDPDDLAEGAALAEAEDPARYADVAADLADAAAGERLDRADAFLDVCADQGYERL